MKRTVTIPLIDIQHELTKANLNPAQIDVLTDDLYFDSHEDFQSPLDLYNANVTDIVNFGNFTFCTSDPTSPYIAPDEDDHLLYGTNHQHRHQS